MAARSLGNQDVTWFLDLFEKSQLDLNPSYQRRSVWSLHDKRFFIDTVLNGYPAPPVFLHKTLDENGRPTYHVVDGKQRLSTLIDFSQGKIRIPEDFGDIFLQKKNWNDLDRATREKFWNYTLIVEMLPDVNDASIRNIFERINRNSRKLSNQELRHAKYDGWFITIVESEAEKTEWIKFGIATPGRAKRMQDVQFISELFKIILDRKIVGFDQDELDDIYANYDDILELSSFVEDDFHSEVERIRSYISGAINVLPDLKSVYKVQSHFYTLWAYLFLDKNRLLPVEEFANKYNDFINATKVISTTSEEEHTSDYGDAITSYAKHSKGASTDLTPRLNRYNALVKAMHGLEALSNENM